MMFEGSLRSVALTFALACSACTVDQEPARYTEVLEIPLGAGERSDLAEILSSAARVDEEIHVDDVSERNAEYHDDAQILDADKRPTISISIWIGEDDDELVAHVGDLGHRGRTWATFLKGKDVQLHRQFRERAVAAIRQRWPESRSIPILPSGGVGNPEDFVLVDGEYRIDRAKASTYGLPNDSNLLASRPAS